jgi:hypothetical protein
MPDMYELSIVAREVDKPVRRESITCDRWMAAAWCRAMASALDPEWPNYNGVTTEPPEQAACRLRAEDEPPCIPLRKP